MKCPAFCAIVWVYRIICQFTILRLQAYTFISEHGPLTKYCGLISTGPDGLLIEMYQFNLIASLNKQPWLITFIFVRGNVIQENIKFYANIYPTPVCLTTLNSPGRARSACEWRYRAKSGGRVTSLGCHVVYQSRGALPTEADKRHTPQGVCARAPRERIRALIEHVHHGEDRPSVRRLQYFYSR